MSESWRVSDSILFPFYNAFESFLFEQFSVSDLESKICHCCLVTREDLFRPPVFSFSKKTPPTRFCSCFVSCVTDIGEAALVPCKKRSQTHSQFLLFGKSNTRVTTTKNMTVLEPEIFQSFPPPLTLSTCCFPLSLLHTVNRRSLSAKRDRIPCFERKAGAERLEHTLFCSRKSPESLFSGPFLSLFYFSPRFLRPLMMSSSSF